MPGLDLQARAGLCFPMASSDFSPLTRRPTAAEASPFAQRVALLAALHVAALAVMAWTETDLVAKTAFLLAWGTVNFIWLALLRRPSVAAALSLALLAILVLLSRFKYDVLQMTVNFVDVMVIEPDTIAYLFALFPSLGIAVGAAVVVAAPLLAAIWWFDPFRIPRAHALGGALACTAGLTMLSFAAPFEAHESFYGGNHVSHFARSGVDAVSALMSEGFLESDAVVEDRLRSAPDAACSPAGRPPHIIMVHDESSFDIRAAPGIRVPPGYGAHFRSFDGKERKLVVETAGGASWYTEYNVLTGLSARSFGRFAYFVTRIAAHRVERGLPLALRRCGYRTYSIYPWHGAFMSARSFQATTGIEHFFDSKDLGARGFEPDRFYYEAATRLIAREHRDGPMFLLVYLAANHFPWDSRYRPELTPDWQEPGNAARIDEYLRRQAMSLRDYGQLLAHLRENFPGESFLLVRYGDHQPEFAPHIMEPTLDKAAVARRLAAFDPTYFTTYYAIDVINFSPPSLALALDTLEGPYLPLVVQEAAGVALDPSFAEQKRILLRCGGAFHGCAGGAEARRFNRLLINAGLVKGL